MKTTRQAYAESDKLLATLEEVNNLAMIDPTKTYLVWKGSQFPGSSSALPLFTNASIDWGDGNSEVGTDSYLSHTYTDGIEYHIISVGNSTSILNNAFQGCSKIVSVKFSQILESVGQFAFNLCTGLTELTIPSSVTSVGNNAFVGCSNLKEVYFKSETPPDIKDTSFDDGIKFIVPEIALTAYTAEFKNYNVAIIYLTNSSDLKNTLLLDPSLLGREIDNNAWNDLNSCTLLGNYYCKTNAVAKKTSHGPAEITQGDGTAFRLVVASANGEGPTIEEGSRYPYLSQTLISLYTGAVWYRLGTWVKSVYVWSSWKQSYSDQIRTSKLDDDLTWGSSNEDYSRLRVVDAIPDNGPGTNIIYFVTES